jgi:RNA polymerase sigma-70 factor (ECF subfamily)
MNETPTDDLPLAPHRLDEMPVEPAASEAAGMASWFEEHGRAVYNYFRFLGASPDEAEELSAETFFRAIRARDVYDPTRASARTWLCRIAHNAWCDTLRRAKRRKSIPLAAFRDLAVDAPSPEERLLWEEQVSALLAAVATLPAADQELIGLRYGGDLDCAAIGATLGVSEGTVRTRLWRALGRLRKVMAA